ncbi:RDD family protein [Propionibacteriaceae bacterium Y1685]|uniref:RDD family protein n=1 Tax=Microlunatus sp. Y1700 TaxID=3418487 RepID=UPI003B77EA3A
MTQIVTGDAVLLDLRPARLPMRILGAAVDLAVVALGTWLWTMVLVDQFLQANSPAFVTAVNITGTLLVMYAYPIVTETATRGRTLGKFAAGTRVTRDDGGTIRFRHALIRWVVFWNVDFAPWTAFLGGLISAGINKQGKRLGDVMAGTMVVRTRPPRALPPVTEIPDELGAWASRLELSRVPTELMTASRQFTQRREHLLKHPRESIAKDLAGKVYARTAPPPPHELDPEEYLAVVVAERRRREADRVAQRSQWVPTADELPEGWR